MTRKQQVDNFLKNCRVIEEDARIQGIIVTYDYNGTFEVIKVRFDGEDWYEDEIEEFSLFDISDEEQEAIVLNFKKKMFEIVGRKRYMIEKNVYAFLCEDYSIEDEDCDDDCFPDDAKERAMREAEEEEEAEQEYERFIKAIEEGR